MTPPLPLTLTLTPTLTPTLTLALYDHHALQNKPKTKTKDASKNDIDHPGVHVLSYPMIYVFPKDQKDAPVAFDQHRGTTNLVRFVSKHSGASPHDAVIKQRPAPVDEEL